MLRHFANVREHELGAVLLLVSRGSLQEETEALTLTLRDRRGANARHGQSGGSSGDVS
jgi:hypothetical protein